MNAEGRGLQANGDTARRPDVRGIAPKARACPRKRAGVCLAMMAAAALGACVSCREDARAPQARTRAKPRERTRDGLIIHWGKPVDGLVLGIAVPRGPHLLPQPSSFWSDDGVSAKTYVKNTSLRIPAGCDGSVRIMSAKYVSLPPGTGFGGGWGCRRPATAHLARNLLDGKARRLEKLWGGIDLYELAKETGAHARLFPDSGEGESQTREWITGRLTLSLHFSNAEGELVGGSWSGSLEARAPVDFAPLEEDAREKAPTNVDGEE